jgi:hypothetical protein
MRRIRLITVMMFSRVVTVPETMLVAIADKIKTDLEREYAT